MFREISTAAVLTRLPIDAKSEMDMGPAALEGAKAG
jgi:hypothetical protein